MEYTTGRAQKFYILQNIRLISNIFSGHSGTEIGNTKNLEKFTNLELNDQWDKKENKKGY